jgi:5S rRNA maturation endonuclease (ribonuclease M5)
MRETINLEKFGKILNELGERIVIVEGRKDKEALKSLGLKNIIAINGRPLHKVTEILLKTRKEIVILTDFDRKGREINSKLRYLLQRYRKKINSRLRGNVMNLGKNKIEDLNSLSLKEVDVHVKTRSNFNKIRYSSANKRKGSHRET